jgi:hypothetical protein
MGGNARKSSGDPQAAGISMSPELLPPQPLLQPMPLAAVAILALGLAAGTAFMFAGQFGPVAPGPGSEREKMFSVSADKTTGAFRILPANFQKSPGSVLAQLNMPEAEKARLAQKLVDGSVRLAAVTLWDTVDEDGDTVDVAAAGFTQRLVIMHKPVTFFLPVQPGGSVVIKAVRDGGGGGVTLGVSTVLGPYRLPPLAVGQAVEIPAL